MSPTNTGPFVINIGRQLGSGGRTIGRKLSEQLGIAYYDKEILSLAAQESGLRQKVFERSDEHKGFFRGIFGTIMPILSSGGDFYAGQLSEEHLFHIQSRVIQRVAAEHSCIFIGRMADYILRHHPRCCNVFVAADTDDRAQRIMNRLGVDHKTAMRLIEEGDRQRADYYNFYSSGTWGAADTYHLCINSSVLGLERTTDFIKQFVCDKLQLSDAYCGNTSNT